MAVVFYATMGGCMAFCGRFAAVGVVLYRVRACGGRRSCRGLFGFLLIICGLHVAVFGVFPIIWKNSSRAAAGVRFFVEKTNKEKKTRKRAKIFIKSVDTDTETF